MSLSQSVIPPARILAVDDEPQIRRFLDMTLPSQGYWVITAEDGASGLAALAVWSSASGMKTGLQALIRPERKDW